MTLRPPAPETVRTPLTRHQAGSSARHSARRYADSPSRRVVAQAVDEHQAHGGSSLALRAHVGTGEGAGKLGRGHLRKPQFVADPLQRIGSFSCAADLWMDEPFAVIVGQMHIFPAFICCALSDLYRLVAHVAALQPCGDFFACLVVVECGHFDLPVGELGVGSHAGDSVTLRLAESRHQGVGRSAFGDQVGRSAAYPLLLVDIPHGHGAVAVKFGLVGAHLYLLVVGDPSITMPVDYH